MAVTGSYAQSHVLASQQFKHYIDSFNANDHELYVQFYPNAAAWSFLRDNIPYFECPDKVLEETYYFRWWTYRKHIRKTPDGFIITEFMPAVGWAGKYNSISCAAGHHFYEGRWLHDPRYMVDYMKFWLDKSGDGIRRYSFWSADAWVAFLKVHPKEMESNDMLEKLISNYQEWESAHRENRHYLFWQLDGADGMEVSVGGQIDHGGKPAHGYEGIRPTINSYMYGDAKAISALAARAGRRNIADTFNTQAEAIKKGVQRWLWSDSLNFFGSIALDRNTEDPDVLPVRELIGYVPWYFDLPDDNFTYARAWEQLLDTAGFLAPFGPTTCERRHPYFTISYKDHECQWNGPSWPYATSQTLTAMANLFNHYTKRSITKADYYKLLRIYAQSQKRKLENGKKIPWIDENLNPFTGDWISRSRLRDWPGDPWPKDKGGRERGKDYNHSTFCDLIISGLIGIRPQWNNTIVVNPLVPHGKWDYFCLDNLLYHDKIVSVFYDKTGKRYHRGRGFRILVNGKEVFSSPEIKRAMVML